MLLDLANCSKLSSVTDDVNIPKSVRYVSLGFAGGSFSTNPKNPLTWVSIILMLLRKDNFSSIFAGIALMNAFHIL